MAFVNEFISPEDRERYRLADFEKGRFLINPGPDWAIDRERDIFLRVIRPAARKNAPDDRDGDYEKDFQFHWKGSDFMVCTRNGLSDTELRDWPGEIFQSRNVHGPNMWMLSFYLRHIGEVKKPHPDAPLALVEHLPEVLNDLEAVLAFGIGGAFAFISPEGAARPRYATLKIAPDAVWLPRNEQGAQA